MLSDAVADNVRTIKDEVPQSIRPAHRRARVWGPRAGAIALPVGLVLALTGIARPPATGPQNAGTGSIDGPKPDRAASPGAPRVDGSPIAPRGLEAPAAGARTLDPRSLARSVDPGVLELNVRRVVIDAGHGGDNLGTAGANGLQEKELTLDIARRTRDLVSGDGFDVIMTRTEDASVSLQQRALLANERQGDIFVSIHLNALKPASAKGIETYYLGPSESPEHDAIAAAENQQSGYSLSDMRSLLERIYGDARRAASRRLAESVQHALVRTVRRVDAEVTDRGVKMAPFVVLVATEMPAILAEVSCLSNGDDAERLRTPGYRQTLAEALATGIRAFAGDRRPSAARERTESSGS